MLQSRKGSKVGYSLNHKQRVASRRNFLKFQVASVNYKMYSEGGIQSCEFITVKENQQLTDIIILRNELLANWETNSTKLGMTVRKRPKL